MLRLTVILIACFILLVQMPCVSATDVTAETDNKENGTVYRVSSSLNIVFNLGTTGVVYSPPIVPPEPFPIEKISKILKQLMDFLIGPGVGCTILAWKVWNIIKRLRQDRPRDYRRVEW